MRKFNYHAPATVEEAVRILDQYQDSIAVIAGGTDLIIELKEGHKKPEHVLDITRIQDLKYIKEEEGIVKIGPLATFSFLEENAFVRQKLPALYETVKYVGSPQIRSLGTVGGNVVNASVAGDSPTVLLTYDAEVVLQSVKGTRVMSLHEFNMGPGNCAIRKDELLTEIRFPMPKEDEGVSYFKVGKRKALAIVVLAVSIYVKRDAENKISDARVVLGAVNKHPMRSALIEEALRGTELKEQELEKFLPLFTQEVQAAIANRPSVVYKREGVRGAAKECFRQLLHQLA